MNICVGNRTLELYIRPAGHNFPTFLFWAIQLNHIPFCLINSFVVRLFRILLNWHHRHLLFWEFLSKQAKYSIVYFDLLVPRAEWKRELNPAYICSRQNHLHLMITASAATARRTFAKHSSLESLSEAGLRIDHVHYIGRPKALAAATEASHPL